MKRTLIMMLSFAISFCVARAETSKTATSTGTDFESWPIDVGASSSNLVIEVDDNGVKNVFTYWSVDNGDPGVNKDDKEFGSVVMINSDDTLKVEAINTSTNLGEKALKLETDGRLSRNLSVENKAVDDNGTTELKAKPVGVGDGLYFDSLVQFTSGDTINEPTGDDKLLVFLYGGEDETAPLGLITNLVVLSKGESGNVTNILNVFQNNNEEWEDSPAIEPNTWHRLTIKAKKANNDTTTEFGIWIDGKQWGAQTTNVVDETTVQTNLTSTFTSLAGGSDIIEDAATAITSISFEGTGALDYVYAGNEDPIPSGKLKMVVSLSDTDLYFDSGTNVYYSVDEGEWVQLKFTMISDDSGEYYSPITKNLPLEAKSVKFAVPILDDNESKYCLKVYENVGNKTDLKYVTENANDVYWWTIEVPLTDATGGEKSITLEVVAGVDQGGTTPPSSATVNYTVIGGTVALSNGAALGYSPATIGIGTNIVFTATEGYYLSSVKIGDNTANYTEAENKTTYSHEVTGNVTIEVTFSKKTQNPTPTPTPGQIPNTTDNDEAQKVVDAATTETGITTVEGTLGVDNTGKYITVTVNGEVTLNLAVKPCYKATLTENENKVMLVVDEEEVFSFGDSEVETNEGGKKTVPAILVGADGSFTLNIQRAYQKNFTYTMLVAATPNAPESGEGAWTVVENAVPSDTDADGTQMTITAPNSTLGTFFKVRVVELTSEK